MKRKRRDRKKYLFILLFLTSVLLTTTSYAWFSTSRVVRINTLNIHVAAEGGLEISSDGTNWKAVLDLEDIVKARDTYPTSVNQIPSYLLPVSTGGNIDNGKLMMYFGEATNNESDADLSLTSVRLVETEGFGNESNGHFIAFDFFLKIPNDKKIYISHEAGVEFDGELNTGIENAFRIAFLNEGLTSTDAPLGQIQGMKGATKAYIWEPNYDVHTQSGVNNAYNVYGLNTSLTGGKLLPYSGIISEFGSGANVTLKTATQANYPAYFRNVKVDFSTVKDFTNNVELLNLNAGITKIRIYIWIEGQDVDCENDASVGDVLVNLQLTTNPS